MNLLYNNPLVLRDLYNEAQKGLDKRFPNSAIKQINPLNKDHQIYAIRYKEIRCVVIKKFPYMAHFFINDENNTVEVLAVMSTDRNPKLWEEKTSKH